VAELIVYPLLILCLYVAITATSLILTARHLLPMMTATLAQAPQPQTAQAVGLQAVTVVVFKIVFYAFIFVIDNRLLRIVSTAACIFAIEVPLIFAACRSRGIRISIVNALVLSASAFVSTLLVWVPIAVWIERHWIGHISWS
jgi:hypothetical protein